MGIKVLLVIVFVIPILFFSALFCVFSRKLQSMESPKDTYALKVDTKLEFNALSKREIKAITRDLLRRERKKGGRRWHM